MCEIIDLNEFKVFGRKTGGSEKTTFDFAIEDDYDESVFGGDTEGHVGVPGVEAIIEVMLLSFANKVRQKDLSFDTLQALVSAYTNDITGIIEDD